MIDKLIEKYKEQIDNCNQVINEWKLERNKAIKTKDTEYKRACHNIITEENHYLFAYKEMLKDLEELKPTTINGYSIEEVITILNALDLERILDIKMTMKNLSILSDKLNEDFNNTLDKSMKNVIKDLGVDTDE